MAVYQTNTSTSADIDGLTDAIADSSWLVEESISNVIFKYVDIEDALISGAYDFISGNSITFHAMTWFGHDVSLTGSKFKYDGTGTILTAGTFKSLVSSTLFPNETILIEGSVTGKSSGFSGTLNTLGIDSDNLDFLLKGSIPINARFFSINEVNISYDNGFDDSIELIYKGKISYDFASGEITTKSTISSLRLGVEGQYIDISGISLKAVDLFNGSPLSMLIPAFLSGNDSITGVGIDQSLQGYAGNDTIRGGDGSDTLIGGAGNDSLNGGAGVDSMEGGTGNDTYVGSVGDIFSEIGGSGVDVIQIDMTHTLGGDFEHLTLTGVGNINGTGNDLNNNLTGNAGNNELSGAAGNDTLNGGLGNDTLNGGTGGDSLIGGGGDDTYIVNLIQSGNGTKAIAKLEDNLSESSGAGADMIVLNSPTIVLTKATTLTVTANFEGLDASGTGATWLNLTGNTANNVLIGNDAANVLTGAAGNDTMIGGLGNDQFVFATSLNASTNIDVVDDFTIGEDKLILDNDIFKALGAPGALAAQLFCVGTAAGDADDRLIYDSATGMLYYDADGIGAGAQIQFAHLESGLALAETSFTVTN